MTPLPSPINWRLLMPQIVSEEVRKASNTESENEGEKRIEKRDFCKRKHSCRNCENCIPK